MSTIPSRRATLRTAISLGALAGGAGKVSRSHATPIKAVDLTPMRSIEWRDYLGVNTQFMLYEPRLREVQAEYWRALGLDRVRVNLHWMLIEPEQNKWRFELPDSALGIAKKHGFRSVVSLVGSPRYASSAPRGARYADKYPPTSPALFANGLLKLVERYPEVDDWQVWNEPNIPGFWLPRADPDAYYELLKTSVSAIRQRFASKQIVVAGMAYYSEMYGRSGLMLEELGKRGVFKAGLVAAYHPYTPAAEGRDVAQRDFVAQASMVNKWLRAAGAPQIWATEWGWSSYQGPIEEQPIVGEMGQASHTLRRLALMAALQFDRAYLFTLADIDARAGPRDRRYGLLTESGEPKPIYHALRQFLSVTGPRLEPGASPRIGGAVPSGLISIAWRRADGRSLWMVWADKPANVHLPAVNRASLIDPLTASDTVLHGPDGVRFEVGTDLLCLVY